MDDFNKDYKDIKQTVLIAGTLVVLDRILPNWLKAILSVAFGTVGIIFLIFGSIVLWRLGFFAGAWNAIVGPALKGILFFLACIFYYGPVNLICYAANGSTCLSAPGWF